MGTMAPRGMKAAAAKAMTKGALADSLASSVELKKSVVTKLLGSLGEIGAAEVKKTGGKPATKATKRIMFGEEKIIKAKPAKTVVKAFPVAALKASIDLGFYKTKNESR